MENLDKAKLYELKIDSVVIGYYEYPHEVADTIEGILDNNDILLEDLAIEFEVSKTRKN